MSKLFDLTKSPISFSDDHTEYIPEHGSMIYTVWDSSDKFIYVSVGGVGKKRNLLSRIRQHRIGARSEG